MEQVAIFYDMDDFYRGYEEEVVPRTKISLSKIMTILIIYHLSGYQIFKWYDIKYVIDLLGN